MFEPTSSRSTLFGALVLVTLLAALLATFLAHAPVARAAEPANATPNEAPADAPAGVDPEAVELAKEILASWREEAERNKGVILEVVGEVVYPRGAVTGSFGAAKGETLPPEERKAPIRTTFMLDQQGRLRKKGEVSSIVVGSGEIRSEWEEVVSTPNGYYRLTSGPGNQRVSGVEMPPASGESEDNLPVLWAAAAASTEVAELLVRSSLASSDPGRPISLERMGARTIRLVERDPHRNRRRSWLIEPVADRWRVTRFESSTTDGKMTTTIEIEYDGVEQKRFLQPSWSTAMNIDSGPIRVSMTRTASANVVSSGADFGAEVFQIQYPPGAVVRFQAD